MKLLFLGDSGSEMNRALGWDEYQPGEFPQLILQLESGVVGVAMDRRHHEYFIEQDPKPGARVSVEPVGPVRAAAILKGLGL